MTRLTPFLGIALLALVGCGENGPTRTEAEIDQGKAHLTTALEAWKKGDPAKKTDAVAFSDDLRRTHALTDFTIGTATVPDARTIAYAVSVKLKDKKGKEEARDLVYLVELGPPVRVSRDPYN